MSLKANRISHLLRKDKNPLYLSEPQVGKVSIRRKKGSQWGNLIISQELFTKRRSEVIGDDAGDWLLPDNKPHISIFTAEEVAQLPKNYLFAPTLEFILTGDTKIIKPKEWKGVSECIFEIIECPEVRTLRMSLGFTPYLYENHEFHITLGIKLDKTSKSNKISK